MALFDGVRTRWGVGCLLCLGFLLTPSPSRSQTFNARDLFAPRLGDYWLYLLNGSQPVTLETIQLLELDGIEFGTSRWTGGPLHGLESLVSFDPVVGAEAISNFQPSIFIDGIGFVNQRQEFDPPVLAAPPVITVGDLVQSIGALTQTYFNSSGSVSIPGTYAASYRLALLEPVEVPFGDFLAIQRQIQIDISLQLGSGQTQEVRVTSRDWLVPGLGSIRLEQTLPTRVDVYELVDTNRTPLPEVDAGFQTLAAAAACVALRRRFARRARCHC